MVRGGAGRDRGRRARRRARPGSRPRDPAAVRDRAARSRRPRERRSRRELHRVVTEADGSAVALATRLAGWDCFYDISRYAGREVPFFKRAQLTAADLQAAGVASFGDLHRLTAFADNLVPHVLSVDGVLTLDPALAARIRAGELLEHDSPEEVELRACALHAIELLAAATEPHLTAAEIDMVLWNRGQQPSMKAHPRPRARTTAY